MANQRSQITIESWILTIVKLFSKFFKYFDIFFHKKYPGRDEDNLDDEGDLDMSQADNSLQENTIGKILKRLLTRQAPTVNSEAMPFTYSVCCYD